MSSEKLPTYPPLQQQRSGPYRSDWVWPSHPPVGNQQQPDQRHIEQQQQQQVQM